MATGTAALAATALPARASAASSSVLAPAAMRRDLDLLLRAYETVHPGLLRYLSAGGFAERIAAAKTWAARERGLADFFVALARLTASVRCGHSYPNPNNHGRAARAALFEGRDRVPFSFRWIHGRMIVTGDRGTAHPIPVGSEILRLDGIAARQMLPAMLPLARADGGNDVKRIAQLGVDARERYPAFDLYRPMLFPARGDGLVRVHLRTPDGRERSEELPASTEAELQTKRAPAGEGLGWTFEIRPDRIGLLTMPDWVTYRSKWDWKTYLDAAVDRLIDERARGLIIDVRGNEGGTECGWHLLERLIGRDTPVPFFERKVRYRSLPADLLVPLETWDERFRDWGPAAVGPDSEGFYRLERPDSDQESISPRGRRFSGPVAVLVDAACSSATFQFAHAIQNARLAMLVGEPTGGNRRGINGDAYYFVRLAETGLEVDLPIVGSFPSRPQPDAGIRPERVVDRAARDIAARRDRQFEAAIQVIGNG